MIGALIAGKRRHNPIGWTALLIGLSLAADAAIVAFAPLLVPQALNQEPVSVWALWVFQGTFVGVISGIILLLHLFPTGRPLSPRWRWVMIGSVIAFVGAVLVFTRIAPVQIEMPSGAIVETPNPFGAATSTPEFALAIFFAALVIPQGLGLVAMALRFLRARGIERQQIKWFLFAVGLYLVVLVLSFFSMNPLLESLVPLVALGMPISIGIAVFRYRLYDIDILIRRTITYALVTTLLLLLYFGGVFFFQRLLAPVSGSSPSEIVTVLSTLALAVLFVPLRNGIQRWIDKRFNRNKYDAQQVLQDFSRTVRDETDLEKLTERLMQVVDETMHPEKMSVWLKNVEPPKRRSDA